MDFYRLDKKEHTPGRGMGKKERKKEKEERDGPNAKSKVPRL